MNDDQNELAPEHSNDGDVDSNQISDVGYKRPPRAHQFLKGKSGNPKGRPRKREISLLPSEMRRAVLAVGGKEIKLKTTDGTQIVSGYGAVMMTLWKKAVSGDVPAIRMFTKIYGEASRGLLNSHPEFEIYESNEKRAAKGELSDWEQIAMNDQRRRTRAIIK